MAEWVRNAVEVGGYPMLALLVLVENVFPPLPSELILPLAGFYVAQGEMHFLLALLASTLGSVAGALILYGIARSGGRTLVLRFSRILRVTEEDLDRADDWFDRYGGWIVVLGRLIPGARSLVSIPAGLSEMPVVRFTLLTTLGSAVWNGALIGAGWALGDNYKQVDGIVGPVGTAALTVMVLAGLVYLVRHYRKRARNRG